MTSRNQKNDRQARARAAMAAKDAEKKANFQTVVGVDSWREVLRELQEFVLGHLRCSEEKVRRFGRIYPSAVSILDTGTIFRNPVTQPEIRDLEERLGIIIPPSYRAFLEASNGLHLPTDGKFLSSSEVRAYRELDPMGADLMEEFAEEFAEEFEALDPPDERYYQYSYARSAIALNGPDGEYAPVGKVMGWALLVREVRLDNGEFEIWQQAFEVQDRFASFSEYFASVRHTIYQSVAHL
jgi:hypothetical protein